MKIRGIVISAAKYILIPVASLGILIYGNFILDELYMIAQRSEEPSVLPLALFSLLVHVIQNVVIIIGFDVSSRALAAHLGGLETAANVTVMPAVIMALRFLTPYISPIMLIPFPMRGMMIFPLLMLFQLLTLNVTNVIDRTLSLTLWVFSFQSIELLAAASSDGTFDILSSAATGLTGFMLFLSFLIGAVSSSWLLAKSSVKLSELKNSWLMSELAQNDTSVREVTMIDINNIAHDFKNTIAVIKGTTRMIERTAPSDKTALIIKAADYMETMISELLSNESMHDTTVGEFRRMVERHAGTFPWRNEIEVISDADADSAVITANRTRLLRTVLNIIDNAWRSNASVSRHGITVRFGITNPDKGENSTAEIEVTDCGAGFSPGVQSAGRSGWGGSGMGLAFSRRIISMHRGSLLIANRGGGERGARVTIYIPLKQQTEYERRGGLKHCGNGNAPA